MASSSGEENGANPVANLAAFLRQNKSDIKILTGKSKLSLTTVYLSLLNRCFATTNPSDSSDEGDAESSSTRYDAESVKYLRDVLHRTVALKLLHEGATLQGAVDVSRFHALTVLEVKRVPIHLLAGLGSLRPQLRVLICSRCVHSLQMLLVGCGGDKAEEEDWPVLHTLNLSYNYIDALDESLRFLPALKALDLSHNNIRHTRDYFESLPELIHLNLSFNQLVRVPCLGEFIPSNIQTLLLRGNNIESLSGVEYLEELGTLDLAKNAIFDTTELFSLGYLHHLRKMYFHGNPFIFQGKWRMFVAKYLSPNASQLMTFIEDIPLGRAEIKVVPSKPISRPPRSGYVSDNFSASYRSDDVSYDNLDDSLTDRGQKKRKARVKRSTAKVRQVSITEHSEDQVVSKSKERKASESAKTIASAKLMPGTEAKREFEDMRQMHGTEWLLALQNPYEDVSKPHSSENISKPSPQQPSVNNNFPSAIERADAAIGNDASIDIASENRAVIQADVHLDSDMHGLGLHNAAEDVLTQTRVPVVQETITRTTTSAEEGGNLVDSVNGHGVPEQNRTLVKKQSSEQFDLLMRQDSELQTRMHDGDLNDEGNQEEEESPDVCGPYLVRLFGSDPPVQLFVTVKERFIEEKNVFGKVTQRLEMKSLNGMTITVENMLDDFNNAEVEMPVVRLAFDYINRDRRKREYVMEDLNSCQVLMDALGPFLVQNEANRTRIFLQCLKCMLEFPKDQAKRKVEKKAKKSNTWLSEEESGSDFESVNEVLACPKCGSTLMLEVDDPTALRSEVSTPYGSVASIDLQARPMASSSPWKPDRDRSTVVIAYPEEAASIPDHSFEFDQPANGLMTTNSSFLGEDDITKTNRALSSGSTSSPTKECSLTTSSSSSQSQLSSDYRLPEPTIKMSTSAHTPVDELANYPPDKLKELLTSNKSGFRQRYSLCPTDGGVDGGSVSSCEASRPTTPSHYVTPNAFDFINRTTGTLDSKPNSNRTSPAHRVNGRSATTSERKSTEDRQHHTSEKSIYNHTRTTVANSDESNIRHQLPDHRYSEDDIIVLDSSDAISHDSAEYVDAYHLQGGGAELARDVPSADAISFGRLDSNESDIAVISETDPGSSSSGLTICRRSSTGNLSVNSDSVFVGSHSNRTLDTQAVDAGHESSSNQQLLHPQAPDHRDELESSHEHNIYASHSNDSGSDLNRSGNFTSSHRSREEANSVIKTSPAVSINSDAQTNSSDLVDAEMSMLASAVRDCCNIHHRLKLFFSMSVFGDDEDFTCLLKGLVCQLSKRASFEGLLVVSTKHLYIMKIMNAESENPSEWLSKKNQHPLRELARLHVGLGSQTVQLEFASEGVLYTIVTGNKPRTRQFITVVTEAMSKGLGKKFKGVQYEHPQTYLNLTTEVFVPTATGDTSYEVDPQVTAFVSAQFRSTSETKQGTSLKEDPVGFLVTATDVYLLDENHFYPLALGKSRKSAKGQQQYTPRGHRKISDIAELELYSDSNTDVTLSFFSEDTGEETKWNISTLSEPSMDQLLEAIRHPWKAMFGVNIQETLHPCILVQEIS